MRKQHFRAALALAGKTQADFAAEQGVTPSHLSQVLLGKRDSDRLNAQIDAVIVEHFPTSHAAA